MEKLASILNVENLQNWRTFAASMRLNTEDIKLLGQPNETQRNPTEEMFKYVKAESPDLSVEEVIVGIATIQRNDVLDILRRFLEGESIVLFDSLP